MKRFDGRYTEGFAFRKPDVDVVFGDKSKITTDSKAINVLEEASGGRFRIEGDISSLFAAVYSTANGTTCTITRSASVDGYQTIYLEGQHQSVINAGKIVGGDAGVITLGTDARLVNDGSISGDIGAILLASTDGLIVNRRSGKIDGEKFAIGFRGETVESSNKLLNLGTVTADGTAVSGGICIDHVVNRGVIKGNIALDSGDDLFDGRRGRTMGVVDGGGDDDRYLIDNARIDLFEFRDNGWDTVVSSVGYRLPENFETLILRGHKNIAGHGNDAGNTLVGNAGDNKLNGYEGNNVLAGGRGDDQLFGGSWQDSYVFSTGDGHDTIQTFQDWTDCIVVADWKGMSDIGDILAHARDRDGGVMISFRGDQLFIDDFRKEYLDAGDFQF